MGNDYYVYILANKNDTVLYTGVTNDIIRRLAEHRTSPSRAFTNRYNISKLVYLERFADIDDAILHEKQIKGGSRAKKIGLIERNNPDWKDLVEDLLT